MRAAWLSVIFFAFTSFGFGRADPADLYERATLEYWGQRYQRSTMRILDKVIWPALFEEERRRLGERKPIVEFPLFGEGKARYHALAFYVPPDRPNIVFPVFSLKFLDDLCTAYAWLQIHDYSLETISEYTAILKYGEPPPGGFPAPLEALGIPKNALEDKRVDQLALGHFVTARTFLLLHEMGHILYRHNAQTRSQSVRNEEQADIFAARVMKRTSLPPLGILVFFLADAHWAGFPASSEDTHPLTGQRVQTLAQHLDNHDLAAKLRLLATEFLDDPDVRAGFVATGKAGKLSALAPRRPGELARMLQAERVHSSSHQLFSGEYAGDLVQFPESEAIPLVTLLERRGDEVQGRYTFGIGVGTIEGQVEGSQLYFQWSWGSNYGRGVLSARADGSLEGTWGYRESRSGAGTWTGRPRP